jgi:hypothetical protein
MTQEAKGNFFAVDRGAFRAAALGGLNAAVSHLVKHVHLVNPVSGRVAGEGSSNFGGWRKDD